MHDGQPTIRRQRREKQTELTLAVVNQLTADSHVQVTRIFSVFILPQINWRLAEIENMQRGPILTVTVGEYPVGIFSASKVDARVADRVQHADAFEVDRLPTRMFDLDLQISVWASLVQLQHISQVGLAGSPTEGDLELTTLAENILEIRFRYLRLGIIARENPLMIDFSPHPGGQDRIAKPFGSKFKSTVRGTHGNGQPRILQ